jgi:hypothetical protein
MKSNAGCCRLRLAVIAIATSLLSGCQTAGFDAGGRAVCLPVVEYSREMQVRVAEELAALPQRAVIVEMMADYTVIREQVNGC